MIEHPYVKYAVALIMEKCNYHNYDNITTKDIAKYIDWNSYINESS